MLNHYKFITQKQYIFFYFLYLQKQYLNMMIKIHEKALEIDTLLKKDQISINYSQNGVSLF